jgi:lipoprotein NlpI
MSRLFGKVLFVALPLFAVAVRADEGVRLDSSGPDERLRIEARINDREAAVALDTGLDSGYLLFRSDLTQLGLSVPESPPAVSSTPGKFPFVLGQACTWTLLGATLDDIHPLVLTVPSRFLKEETGLVGLVGWPAVRRNIWVLNLADSRIGAAQNVPIEATHWARFQIKTDLRILSLKEDPDTGAIPRILVDTGSADGIMLPAGQWRAWRAANPNVRATISADWMVGQGERAEEQVWADKFVLGNIVVTDVPVQQEDEAYTNMAPGEPVIAIGLAALHRLDLVLDGPRDLAYLRPSLGPASPFEHNRLGTAFLSSDDGIGPQVATRVEKGTPAAAAGIIEGDVLLKVNGRDADREPYWKKPAGTKYALVLKRGDALVNVDVALRDLLGPESAAPSAAGRPALEFREVPVALSRDEVEYLLVTGLTRMTNGDFQGALATFDEVIALYPKFSQAYCARAECRDQQGDFVSALADLDRAIALNPGYTNAYADRGRTRFAEGDFEGAIADCDRAITLNPNVEETFELRGAAKSNVGRFADAVDDFDRAIALNPNDPAAFFNRGSSERANGNFDGAIADFSQVIALDPQDTNAYRARGVAREASGDWTGALADYSDAFPHGEMPELFLRFHISVVLRRMHAEEADNDLDDAVEAAEPGWGKKVGSYLAGSLSDSELFAEAASGSDQTLADRQCEAFYYAGVMRLLRNETEAARNLFTKCLATNAYGNEEFALARGELARLSPAQS